MSKTKPPKETHTWQHTVPESYLKRFINADGLLFVYDKTTGKIRCDVPANVAAAKNFYTYPQDAFPPEEMPDTSERKAVEHFFGSAIEPQFSEAVEEAIRYSETASLPRRLQEPLVFHLIMQHIRTSTYREHIRQLVQKNTEAWMHGEIEKQFPGIEKDLYPSIEIPEHNIILIHNGMFTEEKFLEMHMDVLMNYIWMIGIATEKQIFYTSDTPVSRTVVDPTGTKFGENLWGEGVEYALPLDSRHVLLLLERTYFGTRFPYTLLNEGEVIIADHIIGRLNQAQTANCYRCVFSTDNDFHVAENLCKERPNLCVLDRERIRPH